MTSIGRCPSASSAAGSSTSSPRSPHFLPPNRPKQTETALSRRAEIDPDLARDLPRRFRPCPFRRPFPNRAATWFARAAMLTALQEPDTAPPPPKPAGVMTIRLRRILKAAIAPGTSTDPTWAGLLTDPGAREVFTAIRERSIIGRLAGMRRVPPGVHLVQQTGSATASLGEGKLPEAGDEAAIRHRALAQDTQASGHRGRDPRAAAAVDAGGRGSVPRRICCARSPPSRTMPSSTR